MKIKITTTNIETLPVPLVYVDEKMKGVEKFAIPHENEDPVVSVEIGKTTNHHQSGDVFRAEVNMKVRGKHFRATSEKDDLYAAIDDMRNENLFATFFTQGQIAHPRSSGKWND